MRRVFARLPLLIIFSASGWAQSILIQNVTIYDGTGRAPFAGQVRIAGDRIAEVGRRLKPKAGEAVKDGGGLALAPGFIDMHSHADRGLLRDLNAEAVVRQGITTVLVGQDGDSNYPLANWLAALDKTPPAMNVASMAGQATLRHQIMHDDLYRAATDDELKQMKSLLRQELSGGAFGLSTGLEYAPAHFSTTDEVVELSKVAADEGGFYISHVRDEGDRVFDAFREVLTIGAEAHLPVEITHIKLGTTPVWHQAATEMPKLFAEAKSRKIDLRADVYPYTYWHSTIRVIVLDRDYFNAEKVSKAIADNGGADHIRVTRYDPEPAIAGKTLDQIAGAWKLSPVDAYMRIVRETTASADHPARDEEVIVTSMSEDDLRWFIAQPQIAFCTDGELHGSHPRGAGTFPRILGKYVREDKVLSYQEAIRKMTSLAASYIGLNNRGRIAPEYVADLVLFDPARVIDRSTIEQPEAPPDGIVGVMVAGKWVVDDGRITGAHPGKVLRHSKPPSLGTLPK